MCRPTHGASGLPLIVFLYGGNWRSGTKAICPFVAAPLARYGAVVAVPDYRLYLEVIFPAFLEGCAAAVRFAAANAVRWDANPRRLVLLGHSAGAYNVAMLLLDPSRLAVANPPPLLLAERLRAAGGPVEARVLMGLGDIRIILAIAPLFHGKAPVLDPVREFATRTGPPPSAGRAAL